MGKIVVGIDDSDGARKALRWAVEEAAARHAKLDVVHVYDPVPTAWAYADGEIMSSARAEAFEEQIEQSKRETAAHAQAVVDEVVAEVGDIEVETSTIEGHRPAEVLIDRSKDADMVVVGSRGRGGFAGLLLGSVSQQVAQHATCPVVIIRHD